MTVPNFKNVPTPPDLAPLPANVARRAIVMAASAYGVKALGVVLSALPGELAAGIAIVQHLSPRYRSYLAQILDRQSPLQVKQAEAGDVLRHGEVFIAPPDYHLSVDVKGVLCLSQSPKVHSVRPAADVLFISVAEVYGSRAIAVVLTGADSNGSTGVRAIKQHGGITIAQDRETAGVFGMPGAAIETGCVDFILPLNEVAPKIIELVQNNPF